MKESVVSLPHRRDILGIKSIEKFTQLFKWQDPDVIEKRNKEISEMTFGETLTYVCCNTCELSSSKRLILKKNRQ